MGLICASDGVPIPLIHADFSTLSPSITPPLRHVPSSAGPLPGHYTMRVRCVDQAGTAERSVLARRSVQSKEREYHDGERRTTVWRRTTRETESTPVSGRNP